MSAAHESHRPRTAVSSPRPLESYANRDRAPGARASTNPEVPVARMRGSTAITDPEAPAVDVQPRSPAHGTAATSPEMPAVDVQPRSPAHGTAITKPEMEAAPPESMLNGGHRVALLPAAPRHREELEAQGCPAQPASRDLPLYDADDESTTEIVRRTDLGMPPKSFSAQRDRAVLLRMDGLHAGQVVSLSSMPLVAGRHPSNRLRVDDGGVSRYHARIYELDGQHVIEDLQSSNGTFVQGVRITQRILEDGDWVQLGPRVGFRYSLTDRRQEQVLHQLYESSTRDALTGAYNRHHFEERLESELAYSHRHGTDLGLVLIDLDHFKRINDSHGHPGGDAVLRQVALLIRRQLRAEDVFARVGGEELAVLLRGTNLKGTTRVAERLRATVAAVPAIYQERPIPVTLSAGCASLACCASLSGSELFSLADQRLYEAKHAGRNRVVSGY